MAGKEQPSDTCSGYMNSTTPSTLAYHANQIPILWALDFSIYNDHDDISKKFSTYVNDCFTLASDCGHYKALIVGLQRALWRGITHITTPLGDCEILSERVTSRLIFLASEIICYQCIHWGNFVSHGIDSMLCRWWGSVFSQGWFYVLFLCCVGDG